MEERGKKEGGGNEKKKKLIKGKGVGEKGEEKKGGKIKD
jgi:hypothetical protein